jgi:H+/Cl- antiporter ClcA
MKSQHRLALLFVGLSIHLAVTVFALRDHGFVGVFEESLKNWGTRQVFSDLTVALTLVNAWIIVDARRHGRAWLPWVLASLPLGSIASLGYLVWRELRPEAARHAPATA